MCADKQVGTPPTMANGTRSDSPRAKVCKGKGMGQEKVVEAARMEWQVAETQLSDAMQAEKDLVCRMNALQQKTEELEHGPEKASAILKQKSTRLEMEAAVQHRMKVQQWEEEARNRMNDVEEREAAAPSGQLAEEEKERLAALARAAEIQEKVAAALEHNYIAEAGIHGEGYRDIELDEWEEKHSQWEVLSAHKINFDKKYDELHQNVMEMERDEMRKIEREMQCSRPWESTRKVLQQAIPASTAMCH